MVCEEGVHAVPSQDMARQEKVCNKTIQAVPQKDISGDKGNDEPIHKILPKDLSFPDKVVPPHPIHAAPPQGVASLDMKQLMLNAGPSRDETQQECDVIIPADVLPPHPIHTAPPQYVAPSQKNLTPLEPQKMEAAMPAVRPKDLSLKKRIETAIQEVNEKSPSGTPTEVKLFINGRTVTITTPDASDSDQRVTLKWSISVPLDDVDQQSTTPESRRRPSLE